MKKIILFESLWFFLTQILGIFAAYTISIQGNLRREKNIGTLPLEFSLLKFLITFSVVVILFLLVLKFKKGRNIFFKLIFIIVVFLGGGIFFGIWFPSYISFPLIVFLIFVWFWASPIWFHNLLLILGVAGIGTIVGVSLYPLLVIYLFFFVAIYDFIAVYKLKTTQKIAESMVNSQALLGIIVPESFADFQKKITEVKIGNKEENFLILGGGDIIFPLILSSSAIFGGIEKSLIIVLFSLFGLIFSYWLFLKLGKKPMPALLPLFLFCAVGYLVAISL